MCTDFFVPNPGTSRSLKPSALRRYDSDCAEFSARGHCLVKLSCWSCWLPTVAIANHLNHRRRPTGRTVG